MNAPKDTRKVISAKLSKEAAEGWRKFCHGNGVSLSAMMEVAGLQLGEEPAPPNHPTRIEMVEQARAIDIERRSRARD